MKVVFVGDNPSRLNKDPNVAFVGAKCWPKLQSWIENLSVEDYCLINSHTPEELILVFCLKTYPEIKFVALGNEASKRLKKLNIEHFKLDHPSGLNRKLNDKQYELDMLNKCREWLYESN